MREWFRANLAHLLGVIIVAIIAWLFVTLVTHYFDVGDVFAIWLSVFMVFVIIGTALVYFLEEGELRTFALNVVIAFLVLIALRGTAVAFSATAVDSFDRFLSNLLLQSGKAVNPPGYENDSVSHTYDKTCDLDIAQKREADLNYARIAFNNGNITAQEYGQRRQNITKAWDEALAQCLAKPNQSNSENTTTSGATVPPATPKAPAKPVRRNRAQVVRKCYYVKICRG